MTNIINVNGELFLIKLSVKDEHEQLAFEWNKIGPERRSFKRDSNVYQGG